MCESIILSSGLGEGMEINFVCSVGRVWKSSMSNNCRESENSSYPDDYEKLNMSCL